LGGAKKAIIMVKKALSLPKISVLEQAQIIALYQPTLHAIAMRILRCKADAEDIVQETFIKWLNAEHEKIQNTKAYLIRAVTNNCLNHLQSLKRKKEEYLESFHWPEFVEKFRESDFAHMDIEQELTKAFHVLQHKLEPLERAVYVLKEAFDFDYKALQEILDKKQEHCRQLFSRARKKLNDEKIRLNSVIDEKTALMKSFRESCDVGHAADLIRELQNDISGAIRKKI
jgi:RNA polymerase sigma-70 factor (ECF subfamily)